MANPALVAVLLLLVVAGIAGMVIFLLLPARQKILNDEPADNDSRISAQWAGADQPHHYTDNVHYLGHDASHGGGGHDGGGAFH
jgi:hypothetical protein